jgi:hypothetical protein
METEKVKPVAENCAKNVEPEVEPCAVEGISFICGVCQKVLDGCTDHARCVECEDYYLCQPCFEGGKVSKDHDSSHKIQKSEDATLDEAATAEPEDGKESKDPDSSMRFRRARTPRLMRPPLLNQRMEKSQRILTRPRRFRRARTPRLMRLPRLIRLPLLNQQQTGLSQQQTGLYLKEWLVSCLLTLSRRFRLDT